jgi:deazaflavin-dependent oxidoreductase (nitroreductase family)
VRGAGASDRTRGYQQVGDAWSVVASEAGATTHPDWFHHLVADPGATIEIGSGTIAVRARVAAGAERERIFVPEGGLPRGAPQAAGEREIPVVVLERVRWRRFPAR